MNEERLTIKSTDVVVMRADHDGMDAAYVVAERLHTETGAIVVVLPHDSTGIEHLPEEEVHRLGLVLNERFGTGKWGGVLDAAERQDIRWKIPMPSLKEERGIYVWALKAQEEMGELSAALLARIGNRKIPKDSALAECDQLSAVLLRIRAELTHD